MASVAVSELSTELKNQLSTSYATLLLSDAKVDITADNLKAVLTAAKLKVQFFILG
jgi:hypothetical protein